MTTITLCADDYGLHSAINDGILELIAQGRVHATSCMSTAPEWSKAAARLKPWQGKIDLGLHLNLTEGFGSAAPSLSHIIALSYTGWLRTPKMRASLITEIRRQFDAFSDALGCLPDMLDGHQHIHQLPGIRDVLLETIFTYYGAHPKLWIRSTQPCSRQLGPKSKLLGLLGGHTFTKRLHTYKLQTNHGFLGVYNFDIDSPEAYAQYMPLWLKHAQDGALLMCHPAAQIVPNDAIGKQRWAEYSYLQSSACQQLFAQHNICLARLSFNTVSMKAMHKL